MGDTLHTHQVDLKRDITNSQNGRDSNAGPSSSERLDGCAIRKNWAVRLCVTFYDGAVVVHRQGFSTVCSIVDDQRSRCGCDIRDLWCRCPTNYNRVMELDEAVTAA